MTDLRTAAEAALLPCPFCGGDPQPNNYEEDSDYVYECSQCGAETKWLPTQAEARIAWNRRTAALAGDGAGAPTGDVDELLRALASYRQADADGVMVLVSRQACDEAASTIRALRAQVEIVQLSAAIRAAKE